MIQSPLPLQLLRNYIFVSNYIIYYIDTNISYKSITYKKLFTYDIKNKKSIDITNKFAEVMKLHITKRGLLLTQTEIQEKLQTLNLTLYQNEPTLKLYIFNL